MKSVKILGLPTDENSSFLKGAAQAPKLVREMIWSSKGNLSTELGGTLNQDIKVVDDGDLPLVNQPQDDALIEQSVYEIAANHETPLLIGGDHAVTYPIVRGLFRHYGQVSILHVDAHPDLYDALDGNKRSHGSPFARIMEDGLAARLVQVGIRMLNDHQREQAQRFGVEIVQMRRFDPFSVPIPEAPLYISIDLDGLDPAFAPGVSHHEPGGLSVRELLDLLSRIDCGIIGADIVEYNPRQDVSDITCSVAAKLAKELIALVR